MKIIPAAILLAVFAASPEIRYFKYERPVQTPAQRSGQACLSVDPEIFAHAEPGLADLRLYANAVETPYTVRVAASVAGSQQIIPLLNTGMRNGQTVFDAELPAGRYNDLRLEVSAHDFIATVAVTGGEVLSGGSRTKLGEYTVFDLTKQRLGRSTILHLPESTFRFLHFRISGPLKPDDVTGLSVGRMPAQPPVYRTVAESSQATQKDHSTIIEFNLPANVPVDRIAFAPNTAPAVFSRDVTVSAQETTPKPADDQTPPPYPVTSSGNLLRVHTLREGKRIDEERLAVEGPREVFDAPSKWTITIANGDDVPVSLNSVRLEMLERTLCFEAAAGTSYTLYYGDPALSAPRYDYARVFSPQPDALKASAGAEQSNATFQARPDERPFTEKHPILLWVAMIAVIALLGGIAFRSQKPTGKTT